MRKLYQILSIAIILILIYIFQDWLRTFVITSLGGFTKKETVTVVDTKYVKGKIDTLSVFNHYVETKGIILNPEPKTKYITIRDTIRDTVYQKGVKEFNVKVKDSLIDGNMRIQNFLNGDLHLANFKYKPLFPKYIKRTDTLFVTKIITETLTKERALFGVGVGYDWTQNNIQFLGGYIAKNNWQGLLEVEIPFTKQLINGIPNDKNISIKIIKNF